MLNFVILKIKNSEGTIKPQYLKQWHEEFQEKMGVGVELGLEGWMEYGCTGSLFTEAEIVTMGAVQGKV